MIYELLNLKQVTTVVQYFHRLVDELTPLLKDEMEELPPQQRKIIHSLMEKGGTAKPADLVGPTRLSLNTITMQLKRLKDAQILVLPDGGKGRTANYSVPDQLFSIWYQMRYFRKNRRRIEMFVEVLRIWFQAEERFETLRRLTAQRDPIAPQQLREAATTAEYLAASLADTNFAATARDLATALWLRTEDLNEAALAYAGLMTLQPADGQCYEAVAYTELGRWCATHGDPKTAIQSLDKAIKSKPPDPTVLAEILWGRGCCREILGDHNGAIADFTDVIKLAGAPTEKVAQALFNRGVIWGQRGNTTAEIEDYTGVIELAGVSGEAKAKGLVNRGVARARSGNTADANADYTAAAELAGAPKEEVSQALFNRGFANCNSGNVLAAIADYTAVIDLPGAPMDNVLKALVNRATVKARAGDQTGAIAEFTEVVHRAGNKLDHARYVADALFSRGVAKGRAGDAAGAIADYTSVLNLEGASEEQINMASAIEVSQELN